VIKTAAHRRSNLTVCLDTYAHVIAEQAGERGGWEEQIALGRRALEQAEPANALLFAGLEP
jgi:hypothetical protein